MGWLQRNKTFNKCIIIVLLLYLRADVAMVMAVISHPQPPPWAVYIVVMAITKSSNHRYNLSPLSTHFQLTPSQLPCASHCRIRRFVKIHCWMFG